jgi:hypothetical protein
MKPVSLPLRLPLTLTVHSAATASRCHSANVKPSSQQSGVQHWFEYRCASPATAASAAAAVAVAAPVVSPAAAIDAVPPLSLLLVPPVVVKKRGRADCSSSSCSGIEAFSSAAAAASSTAVTAASANGVSVRGNSGITAAGVPHSGSTAAASAAAAAAAAVSGSAITAPSWILREKRASKIRIVERLAHTAASTATTATTVTDLVAEVSEGVLSPYGSSSAAYGGANSSAMTDDVDGVLDDVALTALADSDLEVLLDKLVVRVMSQMVQVSLLILTIMLRHLCIVELAILKASCYIHVRSIELSIRCVACSVLHYGSRYTNRSSQTSYCRTQLCLHVFAVLTFMNNARCHYHSWLQQTTA